MHFILGDKENFGVELELKTEWNNKTALWIQGNRLGDWEDENLLAPFLNSMYRISRKHDTFWLDELEGLSCYETYLTMHPFYNNPDEFFDLPEEDQDALIRFDKFLLEWGENFDQWGVVVTYKNDECTFLWVNNGLRKTFEQKNDIRCAKAKLSDVQKVYDELTKTIPEKDWPALIPK